MDKVILNNGIEMPQLGCGVFHVSSDEAERCMADALSGSYRRLNTSPYRSAGHRP
ncbi:MULTISPECIES: hypothetical protein [Prevotellaceae]|uniref:hypothetical protein n=1 Tax=Prevotellaceae TaxID=171552 RepID=UPI0003D2A0C0|nr:hypothetical protein [Prevotella phocaeensis]ETD16548.1 hypothetical protein HMPREF1199_02217 [Hoylesella oralis CC98A]